MSFRNWLLASTSIAVLALAPISVSRAQDANNPQLRAAFTAYQADQSDENRQKLDELCRGAGFQGLDDCIAALTGLAPADQAPADQPAAAAPASASEDQAAPPPPAPSEAAAPVASSSEQPPPPPPAPKNEAPAAQPAPAPSAPAPSSETAPAAPAAAAPAATPASAPAGNGVLKKLEAAVNAYNSGIADLIAGKKNAQREIDRTKEQIDKICASGGFADTDTCLAQFSLTLSPLPAGAPAQPAASSAEPQAPSSAPEVSPSAVSASQEPSSSVPPVSELPKASEEVTPSAVEVLPSDVSSEAAPILDSAKDQQNSSSAPASSSVAPDQSSAASSVEPPPAQPAGPPPKDDKAAQQDIQPPPPADLSTQTDKGKPKPPDFIFVQPTPPADNPDVKVVQKPKNDQGGLIFQIGINIYISNPEQERNRFYDPNHGDKVFYEDLSFGRTRETILRRDGTKIVTIYARDGDVLQRSKILPNGHEIVLASADPRERDNDSWEDPGRNLPPLVLNIPAKDYILDADGADQDQIDFFLDQPPVEKVRQIYTIDDVKRSARLRDSVRRLEIGGLTFDMGKATISRDQVGSLAKVAKAMTDLLAKNPGEVFLIEGHTDAVGSDVSNLVLSDQRASTVARILTDFYEIPAENLVTQGYGERYLKVKTDGPEPLNRRVTIKRITPLVAYGN